MRPHLGPTDEVLGADNSDEVSEELLLQERYDHIIPGVAPDDPLAGKEKEECRFGGRCFDRNPQHASRFSHPSGWSPQAQRQACRFGAKCYNTDAAHRERFKHPGDDPPEEEQEIQVSMPAMPSQNSNRSLTAGFKGVRVLSDSFLGVVIGRPQETESSDVGTGGDDANRSDDNGDANRGHCFHFKVCCVSVLLVLLLIGIPFSLKRIPVMKYGLVRNTWTGVVSHSGMYRGGIRFIGFWNEFLIFPATLQTVEWNDLHVTTIDGLQVGLGMVLQYTFNLDSISLMYRTFKDDYANGFNNIMRGLVQNVGGEYSSIEMWTKRIIVKNAIFEACKEAAAIMHGMVKCWDVQFLDLIMYDDIEDVLEDRQVQWQHQAAKREEQKSELVRTQTLILESQVDGQITKLNAEAVASAWAIKAEANANADFNTETAWPLAMAAAQETITHDDIKMTSTEIIQFFETQAYLASTSLLVYGEFVDGVGSVVGFHDRSEIL